MESEIIHIKSVSQVREMIGIVKPTHPLIQLLMCLNGKYNVHEALHLSDDEQRTLRDCINIIRKEITDPVAEIAYSLGYNYPNYFSRLFKNKTGMTPQEYRQLN